MSVEELERIERIEAQRPVRGDPNDGLSGLIGLFSDLMTDDEIDDMVAAIHADRERDVPREVDTSDWVVRGTCSTRTP